MTPCEKLGYKVGDRFEITGTGGSAGWSVGTVVILHRDDGTACPGFRKEGCEWYRDFVPLFGVRKISTPLKSGDEITQDGKKYRVTLEEIPQYEFKPGMICRVFWDVSEDCLNRSYCTRVVYMGNEKADLEKIAYADIYGAIGTGYVKVSNLRPE